MKRILQLAIAFASFAGQIRGTMIYPKIAPSPITFLCAIGIPVEQLPFETVVVGYALRMQYFLPNNASELTSIYLRPQPITDRGKDDFNLAAHYRWVAYRAIELMLHHLALPGHGCLLRLICEHAALPLSHESGLLGELLHIVLTPSSSRDRLLGSRDRSYLSAEQFGKHGGKCSAAFASRCKISPLDLISLLV